MKKKTFLVTYEVKFKHDYYSDLHTVRYYAGANYPFTFYTHDTTDVIKEYSMLGHMYDSFGLIDADGDLIGFLPLANEPKLINVEEVQL